MAISDAVHEINRNILLLQGDSDNLTQNNALENALNTLNNNFEKNTMHEVRKAFEE